MLIPKAAKAFHEGKYLKAYDIYRCVGRVLGNDTIAANLILCLRKFRRGQPASDLTLHELKVACILDDFTWHSYKSECRLFQLTPDNAPNELENFQPDMLFIESAWRGKADLWDKKISNTSSELQGILAWCRERHIPTVFWNKEDPVHFNTFLTTAQHFDFVFTTDIDCIPRYKYVLGHERVFLLPFACQPRINNPIEKYDRKDAFCFAGAYYVRYPERSKDLENYIKILPDFLPLEIYDRNYGKEDANYQFPTAYRPFIIGTLPFEKIDKAYKGYIYAINLNSIKQSQTMFARRVYELLGSNTVTVSNFSRGIRMLFGDLVICSDSGQELVRQLREMDNLSLRKLRLAGLRKVLDGHCYEDRLAYLAERVLGYRRKNPLPTIFAIAFVRTAREAHAVLMAFSRQTYASRRLLLLTPKGEKESVATVFAQTDIEVHALEELISLPLGTLVDEGEWLTLLNSNDWYGCNYFLDLALATRYSPVPVIGKDERWRHTEEGIIAVETGRAYRLESTMPLRRCIVHASALERTQPLGKWLTDVNNGYTYTGLAIDPFNYCELGLHNSDGVDAARIAGELPIDMGLPIENVLCSAERLAPAANAIVNAICWNAFKLSEFFAKTQHSQVVFEAKEDELLVNSMRGNSPIYFYSGDMPIRNLPVRRHLQSWLDVTPGLDIQYVFIFKNEKKEKLSHSILPANKNCDADIPEGTALFSFGLRVRGCGKASIRSLEFGHRQLEPAAFLGKNETLLLTNHYPRYGDLYRNGFVHTRVNAYQERGIGIDVFRLRHGAPTAFHEFQRIDVITGNENALYNLLASGRYKRVLVHFLDPLMWSVLQQFPELPKIVWVHGAEIQPWHRRFYNYTTEAALAKAQIDSKKRIAFWRSILNPIAPGLRLVFVSQKFAREVMEDYSLYFPENTYSVIHNPIDTTKFSYSPKSCEQRKKILSISSYASNKYANDLTVSAILKLTRNLFFRELQFHLVGDGPLFEETLAPLRNFSNVTIERRFLQQQEIAALHRENGIFLIPSRWDSQGVSRDEAMSSGLVPITCNVAAIPEFLDENCGILVPPESPTALAEGIERLYHSPKLFLKMSKAAAERVRRQRGKEQIINKEISLMKLNKI